MGVFLCGSKIPNVQKMRSGVFISNVFSCPVPHKVDTESPTPSRRVRPSQ